MIDLIQNFFERDLTPEESQELGRLLETSDQEALRFAHLGEQSYLATGLPAHHWPGGSLGAPGSPLAGHGSSFLVLGLSALGLGGLAAWWWWPQTSLKTMAPPPVKTSLSQRPAAKPASASIPMVKPLAPVPGLEGKELNVVVDAPQESLVTVRVVDPQGMEVRLLYTGFLKPGHWSFTWDGLLSNGQPALAGKYAIQVLSDRGTMTKNVDLTVHP
jgi:hypothetical protein